MCDGVGGPVPKTKHCNKNSRSVLSIVAEEAGAKARAGVFPVSSASCALSPPSPHGHHLPTLRPGAARGDGDTVAVVPLHALLITEAGAGAGNGPLLSAAPRAATCSC